MEYFRVFINPGVLNVKNVVSVLLEVGIQVSPEAEDGFFLSLTPEEFVEFESCRPRLGLDSERIVVQKKAKFSKRELLANNLISIWPSKQALFTNSEYATLFDTSNACSLCGIGAVQMEDMLIRSDSIPRNTHIATTLTNDILISGSLHERLLGSHLSGYATRPARDLLRKSSWFQLIPSNRVVLSDHSLGIEFSDACPSCGQVTFSSDPHHWEKLSVSFSGPLFDFNYSSVPYGLARRQVDPKESMFPSPVLIGTPKLISVLFHEKLKHCEFLPVVASNTHG